MIRIYIVTYNSELFINANLKSLFESDANPKDYSVEIINNYSILNIHEEYLTKIKKIHHQSLRHSLSAGNLAKDWNSSLILGFESLTKPACEQVILCQDDMIWNKDWKERLDNLHLKYTFYTCGLGDSFMSFKVNSIRRIGLFDERFSNSVCHENDFYLRAIRINGKYSSINDTSCNFFFNKEDPVAVGYVFKEGENRRVLTQAPNEPHWKRQMIPAHYHSVREQLNKSDYSILTRNLFKLKWNTDSLGFNRIIKKVPFPEPRLKMSIHYPHFEKGISDLRAAGYEVSNLAYIAEQTLANLKIQNNYDK